MLNTNRRLLLFALSLLLLAALTYWLPVAETLLGLLHWINQYRGFAWLLFVCLYVVATVLMVPGTILTVSAGFVFGLTAGVALVSVASTLAATAAFLVGRLIARDWVRAALGDHPRMAAVDRATEESGWLIVLLMRLSPLFPFNATNYLLSLTGVSLKHYFFSSWIGMLPGTILYVYLGSAAGSLLTLMEGDYEAGNAGRIMFAAGLVATIVVAALIARKAGSILRRELSKA